MKSSQIYWWWQNCNMWQKQTSVCVWLETTEIKWEKKKWSGKWCQAFGSRCLCALLEFDTLDVTLWSVHSTYLTEPQYACIKMERSGMGALRWTHIHPPFQLTSLPCKRLLTGATVQQPSCTLQSWSSPVGQTTGEKWEQGRTQQETC